MEQITNVITVRKSLAWLQKIHLGPILGTALVYDALAELSRLLASTPNSVTPVWPPDGFAVGITLLCGKRVLPGVFLGSFGANIQAFWDSRNLITLLLSTLAVLGIAAGTTAGTQLGTFLFKQSTQNRYPFNQVSDTIRFLVYAGLLGPIVNATMGVGMLAFAGKINFLESVLSVWLIWWVSNVAGIFILTPLILSGHRYLKLNRLNCHNLLQIIFHILNRKIVNPYSFQGVLSRLGIKVAPSKEIEFILLMLSVFLISFFAFWNSQSIAYVLIPLLIWAVFRFGDIGANLTVFLISLMAVLGTVRGLGSFASPHLSQSLMGLQSFIVVVVFTSLILTAVLAEQNTAKVKLNRAFADLKVANHVLEHQAKTLVHQNRTLERTLEKLKFTQAQMVQSEKMSALGNLIAGVAHEINNPISFLDGSIENVEEYTNYLLEHIRLYQQQYPEPKVDILKHAEDIDLEFLEEDFPRLFEAMHHATNRVTGISKSLRAFTRSDTDQKVKAQLEENLNSTILILKYRLKGTNQRPEIRVVRNYGNLPEIYCFPGQMNQVFMNVLANAIDAIDESAVGQSFTHLQANPYQITVTTKLEDNQIMIAIADNAKGMNEATITRVFDHLFTTKGVNQGTGIGLSIAREIVVAKHGGSIDVQSQLNQGTEFLIRLPIE
ncbi:MASE1 domain-containing protein [Limnothrix redekei]|uniref:histidine kinase n=1 Tax=Limnothrix redekei LRLZ20PSL1 TaxID=3112953 RepID=A0ABW7C8F6_9CYAN